MCRIPKVGVGVWRYFKIIKKEKRQMIRLLPTLFSHVFLHAGIFSSLQRQHRGGLTSVIGANFVCLKIDYLIIVEFWREKNAPGDTRAFRPLNHSHRHKMALE